MSPLGPPPITRLVLSAHVMFMNPDGSNCRVGVRRLAAVTGLNKDTVATHRARAIEIGWLITIGSAKSSSREVFSAVPDEIVDQLSEAAIPVLSSDAGQSNPKPVPQLSGPSDAAVRRQPLNCPTGSDIPLIPLSPLSGRTAAMTSSTRFADGRQSHSAQLRLRKWLQSSDIAQKYQHDPQTLARLAPLHCQFPEHEDFIRLNSAVEKWKRR